MTMRMKIDTGYPCSNDSFLSRNVVCERVGYPRKGARADPRSKVKFKKITILPPNRYKTFCHKHLIMSVVSATMGVSTKVGNQTSRKKQNGKHSNCWLTVHHSKVWSIRHNSGSRSKQERHFSCSP
jgi:hypothetical protein